MDERGTISILCVMARLHGMGNVRFALRIRICLTEMVLGDRQFSFSNSRLRRLPVLEDHEQ